MGHEIPPLVELLPFKSVPQFLGDPPGWVEGWMPVEWKDTLVMGAVSDGVLLFVPVDVP